MFSHAPVMINESIDSLVLNKSGAYLDCTFGLGGHSKEILKRLNSKGTLNSIDQDQTVIEYAKKIQDLNSNTQNFQKLESFLSIGSSMESCLI